MTFTEAIKLSNETGDSFYSEEWDNETWRLVCIQDVLYGYGDDLHRDRDNLRKEHKILEYLDATFQMESLPAEKELLTENQD